MRNFHFPRGGKEVRRGGAYVFVTGHRQAELDKAKTIIGKNVNTVQGDVANAGFVEIVTTEVATPEHFDKTFDINTL